jgi:hypothetical protein
MSNKVSINDLNPRPSKFTLAGKTYEMKKFSLAAQVWAHDEFATAEEANGLNVLSQKLVELDPSAIAKTCYFLLKDKTDFPNEESFIDALGDHYSIVKILLEPFSRCLGVSQLSEDDTAEEVELKK